MNFLIPQINDVIDIIIVAFIIYQLLLIIIKSGSYQIIYGFVFLFAIYFISIIMNLEIVSGTLSKLKSYWFLILIILFQPEIRALLAKLSVSKGTSLFGKRLASTSYFIPLIDAVSELSFKKIGAIIVIENKRNLNEYILTGELLDAQITPKIIVSIFHPKSMLHDGAMIISKGRIASVKVVLPLSKNQYYSQHYGTRHLAAIGISEISDAFVIVVSEETGRISIAQNGNLQTNVAFEELMQFLTDAIK